MTRDEAIAIRSRQLAGEPVDESKLDQAVEVLRQPERRQRRFGDVRAVVLETLLAGPIERDELYATVPRTRSSYGVIQRMRDAGLIRCEMRLTEEGLRALGLAGPKLDQPSAPQG
jgi:hypothetical protein